MPLSGTLDVTPLLEDAPRLAGYDAAPWEIERAEVLTLSFEIDDTDMGAALPPALHPTIPPIVIFTVARYPDSPVGPFMLAQVRAGCRASALPRGFLLRAYSDSPAACEALAAKWGYACHPADVRLRRNHDRVSGEVTLDGAPILRVTLADPEPISGGDVQYVSNMNLARAADDGGRGVLVQVDPDYRFHRAERGRPRIDAFDRGAWRAELVDPRWPVAATFTLCDTNFPRIRYVLDPSQPAMTGTRKVDAAPEK